MAPKKYFFSSFRMCHFIFIEIVWLLQLGYSPNPSTTLSYYAYSFFFCVSLNHLSLSFLFIQKNYCACGVAQNVCICSLCKRYWHRCAYVTNERNGWTVLILNNVACVCGTEGGRILLASDASIYCSHLLFGSGFIRITEENSAWNWFFFFALSLCNNDARRNRLVIGDSALYNSEIIYCDWKLTINYRITNMSNRSQLMLVPLPDTLIDPI